MHSERSSADLMVTQTAQLTVRHLADLSDEMMASQKALQKA